METGNGGSQISDHEESNIKIIQQNDDQVDEEAHQPEAEAPVDEENEQESIEAKFE